MKKKPIQEAIDKALDLGKAYKLSNEEIGYLIKAIAQERFGDDANYKLAKFKICITEEDAEGIVKAKKLLEEYSDLISDLLGNFQDIE